MREVLRRRKRVAMDERRRGGRHAVDRTAVRVELKRAEAKRHRPRLRHPLDDRRERDRRERRVHVVGLRDEVAAAQGSRRGVADEVALVGHRLARAPGPAQLASR